MLDDWAAAELNLPFIDEKGFVNGKESRIAIVNSLTITGQIVNGAKQDLVFQWSQGKTNVIDQPQLKYGYATSAYGGVKIAGILGMPLLKPFISRWDFWTNTLTLFNPGTTLRYRKGVVHLPIAPCRSGYCVRARFVRGNYMSLLIDTGAVSTALVQMPLKSLPIQGASKGMTMGVEGKSLIVDELVLFSLEFEDKLKVHSVVAQIVPRGYVAHLGTAFLSRFRLTLDPNRPQLSLEPSNSKYFLLPGRASAKLKYEDGAFLVKSLTAGSDVRKGPLKVGDKILSIDGLTLDESMQDVAQELLDGREGTHAELMVQRGNEKIIPVRLQRLGRFASGLLPSTGLILKDTLTIESVAIGSIGESSGLAPNDLLVQINDIEVMKVSDDLKRDPTRESEIAKEFIESLLDNLGDNGPLYLKVLRKSSDEILEFDLRPKNLQTKKARN